jgi:diaminohydroxyphosphoribosylaminopyrimidine deaminase / 5-amino-6-(5-phosphoribosylamino)uracil reductase
MFSAVDHGYMQRALEQAQRSLFIATPNPRVGCVLVKDDVIIAEGFTQAAGGNHAEAEALQMARQRGINPAGATAYVTLEPCSHFGRTPPCATALIEAGIARVVAAMEDPNPQVSGRGFTMLRDAGIDVRCGLFETRARELNLGFVSRMVRGRPWIRMKIAASLDGGTALLNGASRWITGSEARRDGHAYRARACAILTGIGTVRNDNPLLNVRDVDTPRQPTRILVDSRLEVDVESRLVASAGAGSAVLIVHAARFPSKEQELADHGCELLFLPNPSGKVNLPALMSELARRGINELHVEAGTKLNGSLIREQCVDELLVYMAPSIMGKAQAMFDLPGLETLEASIGLVFRSVELIGPDLRIIARLTPEFADRN